MGRAALIDTHCHLADPVFDADRTEVIARARAAGVRHALVMGETLAGNQRVLEVCAGDRFMLPCLGHYPEHLDATMAARSIALIRAQRDQLAGIGEVGLDYRLAELEAERAIQRRILAAFVQLANQLELTLSVHSRSAGHHAIDLLVAEGARRVVLHAFDGRAVYARRALEHGYAFSIPPSIVRSPQKVKLVAALPLEALLLESDAPVLGPEREQRNEPASLRVAAERIAEIKRCDVEQVAAATSALAGRLFRL